MLKFEPCTHPLDDQLLIITKLSVCWVNVRFFFWTKLSFDQVHSLVFHLKKCKKNPIIKTNVFDWKDATFLLKRDQIMMDCRTDGISHPEMPLQVSHFHGKITVPAHCFFIWKEFQSLLAPSVDVNSRPVWIDHSCRNWPRSIPLL